MAGRTQMVFRYTQISQYLRCLRSNRYRYLDGVHSVHCLIDWQDKHESLRLKPVRTGNVETLYYYAFPREQWRCLRTNNPLERHLQEVRRRTRAVGAFPDRKSTLMRASARLRGKQHESSRKNFRLPRGGDEQHHQTYDSKICEISSTLPTFQYFRRVRREAISRYCSAP